MVTFLEQKQCILFWKGLFVFLHSKWLERSTALVLAQK